MNISEYLLNGGCLSKSNYNIDDYDDYNDLEKIGMYLDDRLKDCIEYKLVNPDTMNTFYTIHNGSIFDVYIIYVLSQCNTNLYMISLTDKKIHFYDFFLMEEEMSFDNWELFLKYIIEKGKT